MVLKYGVGETLENPLDCKEIKPVNPKGNQSWIFIGRADSEAEAPIVFPSDAKSWLIRRPWCWERLRAGGEGDNRGGDSWMASLNQWARVWASSGSWRWIGKPEVLQSMGSQTVGHDWPTEQQQGETKVVSHPEIIFLHCWDDALMSAPPDAPNSMRLLHSGWWAHTWSSALSELRWPFRLSLWGGSFPSLWQFLCLHILIHLQMKSLQTSGALTYPISLSPSITALSFLVK